MGWLQYGWNLVTHNGVILAERPDPFESTKIGNQVWMTHNWNMNDGQGGIIIATPNSKWLAHHGPQCYYTPEAAKRIASYVQGWHIPSNEEWATLFNTVGGAEVAGKMLKSKFGWDGSSNAKVSYDVYGMSFFSYGYCYTAYGDTPTAVGQYNDIWTSTDGTFSGWLNYVQFNCNSDGVSTGNTGNYQYHLSLRLIKD